MTITKKGQSKKVRSFVVFAICFSVIFSFVNISHLANYNWGYAEASSVISVKSGNWSDPSVWSGGFTPRAGDDANIVSGHTVIYDVFKNDVLNRVMVHGTLKFSRSVDTRLKTKENILVMSGGYLNMGTPNDYIPRNVKAEVIFVFQPRYVFESGDMNITSALTFRGM